MPPNTPMRCGRHPHARRVVRGTRRRGHGRIVAGQLRAPQGATDAAVESHSRCKAALTTIAGAAIGAAPARRHSDVAPPRDRPVRARDAVAPHRRAAAAARSAARPRRPGRSRPCPRSATPACARAGCLAGRQLHPRLPRLLRPACRPCRATGRPRSCPCGCRRRRRRSARPPPPGRATRYSSRSPDARICDVRCSPPSSRTARTARLNRSGHPSRGAPRGRDARSRAIAATARRAPSTVSYVSMSSTAPAPYAAGTRRKASSSSSWAITYE